MVGFSVSTTTTSFKQEFGEALDAGADHEALRKLVEGYYSSGGTKTEAYEAIQSIWIERGFDDDEHQAPNPKRDALESVMEQVWYWDE